MPVEEDINNQLKVLPEIVDWFDSMEWKPVIDLLRESKYVMFIGCGSSYYVGITASRYLVGKLKKTSFSFPAGEILVASEWNLPAIEKTTAVLISRSGKTTEVVEVAKILKKKGITTVGITLDEKSSLAETVEYPIVLPYDEKSIVMTRSFTGMLLTLELLIDKAAQIRGNQKDILKKLPEIFDSFKEDAKKLSHGKHYVFLGIGPYEGIARESALKLQEMSLTTTESYSTLEYRHGPKSLVEPGVIVVIYGNGEHEIKLAEEINELGGTAVVREKISKDYEDSFVQVIFAQLMGLEIAKRKGVNVESPRNLTKVVRF